ncbi:hypothetical protein NFI96_011270 [Prochilodus magdalenae]|nr:hypothetical protein NFI96_011270 [Prochilodus magdalenae]
MAEALLSTQDSFTCPICLDLLKDPVAIPCGHSFCLGCIKDCWDQDDQRGAYSCPQCRHTFTPRPVLNKNTLLAELAEGLRRTRLQAAPPAASGDVECDVCTGTKQRAAKSCLACLLSFCETHIQPHYDSPAYRKHKLMDASVSLREKICSRHEKLLEVFCRTDQQCVCLLCVMDEHGGHKTVSAAAERAEKQKQLVENQRKLHQSIQQTEDTLRVLRQAMENLRRSAQAAEENSEEIFAELIQSIERRRSEVREQIRAQEKAELSQAEELLKKLEQEVADLRRRDSELEQLSHTEDHIHFLQSFQPLSAAPQSPDLPRITVSPQFSLEELKKAVAGVTERVKAVGVTFSGGILSSPMKPATWRIPQQLHQSTEPKTREDFLRRALWFPQELFGFFRSSLVSSGALWFPQELSGFLRSSLVSSGALLFPQELSGCYGVICGCNGVIRIFPSPPSDSCQLTLDPNTAHIRLALSERNRKVTVMCQFQPYPDHPERFKKVQQVFSREGLSRRCYWEVELKINSCSKSIAVSYKGISRNGGKAESEFGCDDQSWSLSCFSSRFCFRHNDKETKLPVVSCSRIGVYVDHGAGVLAFYSVSGTMTLLHRVHTTFTQPLYAGFQVCGYDNVLRICDLN